METAGGVIEPQEAKTMRLVQDALAGNLLAAGRIIKMIEDEETTTADALKALYPHTGHAFIVGITGPPGAGKSTLINALIAAYRKRGQKVGVLAIDPSSRMTGGALLGDRIRMKRHTLDPGVYIRSIATRGALGGLSRSTKGALIVLDAMKYDIVFIETVGVGQSDIDISLLAHMTLVLCIPGMGDILQALKAGTLEIADLFIVNKADKPEANEVVDHLENMLHMKAVETGRRPGVLKTAALEEQGIETVVAAMETFRGEVGNDPVLIERLAARQSRYMESMITELVAEKIRNRLRHSDLLAETLEQLHARRIDPYSAAQVMVKHLFPSL